MTHQRYKQKIILRYYPVSKETMGLAQGLKTLHDLHIRTVREKEVGSQKRFTFCVSVLRQSHARCIRPTSFVSLKTILRVIHINKLTTTAREHITPVSIAFFSHFNFVRNAKICFSSISTHL